MKGSWLRPLTVPDMIVALSSSLFGSLSGTGLMSLSLGLSLLGITTSALFVTIVVFRAKCILWPLRGTFITLVVIAVILYWLDLGPTYWGIFAYVTVIAVAYNGIILAHSWKEGRSPEDETA